jgi:type VI secretion system protein ImpG
MIEKYYEEELRYLYESGKEFAHAHPDRASLLNVDAVGDRDPYVERLFEGFAFLAGRIREKLDDSFPELTEGLFNLMWPGFLQELPSIAIVQFKPRTGLLQETRILPRGSELLSSSVGPESCICKFTTTSDVCLNPISLSNVVKTVDTKGKASLAFHLTLDPGVKLENLKLSPLRIYLHAETPIALMLHEFLTQHVESVSIQSNNNPVLFPIRAKEAVTPAGFSRNESILPPCNRSFHGYSLLLEYFAYPEKFLFVDFNGFENLPFSENSPESLVYTVTFTKDFPINKPFSRDTFRLFCSPAANIFKKDAEPVHVSGLETEYRVTADAGYRDSIFCHSIVAIEAVERASGERSTYQPLYSFANAGVTGEQTFATQYRMAPNGKRELYILPGGNKLNDNEDLSLREEDLSISIYATNGILPREELREGSITNPGSDFPDYVSFSNITRPTLPIYPPSTEEYLWACISHLSSTYMTLASAENLKAILAVYDWSHSEGRARRLEAISNVHSKPVERLVFGSTIRGVEFTVELTEASFADIGDIHLFGEVVKEFLSLYVSVNIFLDLVFICKPSGAVLRWQALEGKKWLI